MIDYLNYKYQTKSDRIDRQKRFLLQNNVASFKRVGREEALKISYEYFVERHYLRTTARQAADKTINGVLVVMGSIGGGKSYFLDELAACRREDLKLMENLEKRNDDIYEKCKKEMCEILDSSVSVCVSFNFPSPVSDIEKERYNQFSSTSLAYRMIYVYVTKFQIAIVNYF